MISLLTPLGLSNAAWGQTSKTWSQYGGTSGENRFANGVELVFPLVEKWRHGKSAGDTALGGAVVDGDAVYVAVDNPTGNILAPRELNLETGQVVRVYRSRSQLQNLNWPAASQTMTHISDDGVVAWCKGNVERRPYAWQEDLTDPYETRATSWQPISPSSRVGAGMNGYRWIDYWGPYKIDYRTGESYVTATNTADGPHVLWLELWDFHRTPDTCQGWTDPAGQNNPHDHGGQYPFRRTLVQRADTAQSRWDGQHWLPASVALSHELVFVAVNPKLNATNTVDIPAALYALNRARSRDSFLLTGAASDPARARWWTKAAGLNQFGQSSWTDARFGVAPEDVRWSKPGSWGGVAVDTNGARVYAVNSTTGRLHAFDLATGAEAWNVAAPGPAYHPPAIASRHGLVVVIGNDARLAAYRISDGSQAWSAEPGGGELFTPAKVNRGARANGNMFVNESAHLSTFIAVAEGGEGAVVVANGTVLKAFALATGQMVWDGQWDATANGPAVNPVIVDNALVVAGHQAVVRYWNPGNPGKGSDGREYHAVYGDAVVTPPPPPTGGQAGSGGAGGATASGGQGGQTSQGGSPSGGAGPRGGATGAGGETDPGEGGSTIAGAGGETNDDGSNDDSDAAAGDSAGAGCGCAVFGRTPRAPWTLGLLGGLAVLVMRRRRHR